MIGLQDIMGNMKSDKRKSIWLFLLFFVCSAFVLFFVANCSPFYDYCSSVDDNTFMLVIERMKQGKILYKDIFEQKGPYWFWFWYLLQMIAPRSFTIAYIAEAVSLSVFCWYTYQIFGLFYQNHVKNAVIAVLSCFSVFTSPVLSGGGCTDEFGLPFFAYGMFVILRYLIQDTPISNRTFFIVGIHIGLLFWSKYLLMLFYLGCFLFLLYKHPSFLWKGIAAVFAGFLLVSVPVGIYFGSKGALRDLIDVYFLANITDYGKSQTFMERVQENVRYFGLSSGVITWIAGFYFGISMIDKQSVLSRKIAEHKDIALFCGICLICTAGVIVVFAKTVFPYYYFTPFVLLPLCYRVLAECVSFKKSVLWIAGCVMICCLQYVTWFHTYALFTNEISPMFFETEKIASDRHYMVADYINEHGGGTLLVFGSMDTGYYQVNDYQNLPDEYYIAHVSARFDVIFDAYLQNMADGKYDYVVYEFFDQLDDAAILDALTDAFADRGYELCLQEKRSDLSTCCLYHKVS